jgi:hypothetical protein
MIDDEFHKLKEILHSLNDYILNEETLSKENLKLTMEIIKNF